MTWLVIYHPDFDQEISHLPEALQKDVFLAIERLEIIGPTLSRPHADTLKGSRIKNLKELRCFVGGQPWRIAYAFDPVRRAVLLVGGSKAGVKSDLFYDRLIRTAEKRWEDHLQWNKKDL
jgi:hypothetical protein